MRPILFVSGGPERARRVLETEHRIDWSQAFPHVLEKWGLVDVATLTAEQFCAGALDDAACVLVADVWDEVPADALIGRIRQLGRPVLFGSPVPSALRPELGILAAEASPPEFRVRAVDPGLRKRAAAYGYNAGGHLAADRLRMVPRERDLDWDRFDAVPIDACLRDAWRAPVPPGERWDLDRAADVLADCEAETGDPRRWAAVVRRERLRACSFHVFDRLARTHSAEPWESQEHRSSPRLTGVETLILAVIDEMHAESARPRVRVLPWPRGASWALNVRHDLDRPLTPAEVDGVVEAHARAGTRATWYWRASTLRGRRRWSRLFPTWSEKALRRVVPEPAHEIAHHTEHLWDGGDREQALIEAAARGAVRGTSAHGDPRYFRFQGAPNALWAERQGLAYTELIQQAHFHPHRFLIPQPDGSVRASRVICLPHHESFDLSMREGDTNEARILSMAERFRAIGGLLQVMNHPDLNQRALFDTLHALPREGRWDCTALEAVEWWSRTHVLGAIRTRGTTDGTVEIVGDLSLEGLGVEILLPDGGVTRQVVDLTAGTAISVNLEHHVSID